MLSTYRRDMQRAWNRIHDVPTQRLHTRFGTVEYAERGEGLPILNCHGVLGCHADGVDGWWTNMLGAGYRVISPSRFGYFGSTLQPDATPADQADAYALLLDHLLGAVYGSERLFWAYRALLPSIYGRMVGVPRGYQPTPDDLDTIRAVRDLQFPLRARKAGAIFDRFVSNLVADRFPLELLTVPTLIISAVDDHWAPYRYAVTAAEHIPGAKLVTIEQGGHLFLRHDAQVRTAVGTFIASVTQREGEGR